MKFELREELALWLGDFKLTADRTHGAFLDFTMSGKRGNFSVHGTLPNCMVAAFTD